MSSGREPAVENEKTGYYYNVELTREVALIHYLAEVYRLDLEFLLHLYDKVGENLIFFFFMFSGKQIIMPKRNKLMKIVKVADEIYKSIAKDDEINLSNPQDEKIRESLASMVRTVAGQKKITIKMEMPHVVPKRSKHKVIPPSFRVDEGDESA